MGRVSEAIEILEVAVRLGRLNSGFENWDALGYAYARASRREEAEKLEAGLSPNRFNSAIIFAGLGEGASLIHSCRDRLYAGCACPRGQGIKRLGSRT